MARKTSKKSKSNENYTKNASNEQYTQAQMIEALTFTHGMKTIAAKRLGCTFNTVVRYMELYPAVAQAAVDARESMLDEVELKLYQNCMKGMETSLIFMLKTIGRKRGYAEKIDLNVSIEALRELSTLVEKRGRKLSDVVEEMLQEMRYADTTSALP